MIRATTDQRRRTIKQRFDSLLAHVPPGQLGRYLVVGIWNVVFGYATYALFTALLAPHVRSSYLLALVLSALVNITVAFLGYKWFVFKTKGNYLTEWFRCIMMYSSIILFGLIALPVLVFATIHLGVREKSAPYIAGLILAGLNVLISFVGHKTYSFRPQ